MTEPAHPSEDQTPSGEGVRARIVEAAAALIASGGREAATTRAVSAAAGVQAPTIYRLFGDKRGLLDAVAEDCMASYIASKAARPPHLDPVQDLRDGWDIHVAFGVGHPALYAIMYGQSDARPPSPLVEVGRELLRLRVRRIALAGRLRVSEPRAMFLLQSACVGTVLSLLSVPELERDLVLSQAARDVVMAAITGDDASISAEQGPHSAATTLRASLDELAVLTSGEQHLLGELLDRIADGR